jgi:hypothetical protein
MTMAHLDSYRAGSKVLFSGVYRVFHGHGHAQPHCVTLIANRYFPRCLQCESFVRFELIFEAPYISDHEMFRESE